MDTTSYRRQIPPVQFVMDFAEGYHYVRHGGVEGFMKWLGYVFISMFLVSLVFLLLTPTDKLNAWWAWLLYLLLVPLLATLTLGSEIIRQRKKAG